MMKPLNWKERLYAFNTTNYATANDFQKAVLLILSDPSTTVRFLTLSSIENAFIFHSGFNYWIRNRFPEASNIPGSHAVLEDFIKLKLINIIYTDPQAEVRRIAVQIFGRTAESQAWKPVYNAIQDQDELVRAAAITSIIRLHDAGLVPQVVIPNLVTQLIAALSDTRHHVRSATFLALGHFTSDPRVLPIFREELLVKRHRPVKELKTDWRSFCEDLDLYSIISGLGRSNNPDAFENLIAALNQSNRQVRFTIVTCLKEMSTVAVAGYPPIIEAFIERFEDTREIKYIRRFAAEGLGKFKNPIAYPSLIKALEPNEDDLAEPNYDGEKAWREEVQLMAAEALGDFGSKQAVPFLIKLLATTSPNIKGHITRALEKLGHIR